MATEKTILKSRLILYDHGRVLLLKQTKPNGGNYTLVGGTIESNELARETLVRESFEEAAIVLEEKDLILVHVLQKHKRGKQRITLYFKALKWKGSLKAQERKKFKSTEWFNLENLPEKLTESARVALNSYRKGILFSELKKELPA